MRPQARYRLIKETIQRLFNKFIISELKVETENCYMINI